MSSAKGCSSFARGALGMLAAGWVDVANPVTLVLSGTEGHAAVVNGELFFQSKHVAGADGKPPWTELPDPWPHAFDLFLDAVTGRAGLPLVPCARRPTAAWSWRRCMLARRNPTGRRWPKTARDR